MKQPTPEQPAQPAHDSLNRMEVPNAQNYSSGELGELVVGVFKNDNPLCKDGGAACVDCLMRGNCIVEAIDAAMNPAALPTTTQVLS